MDAKRLLPLVVAVLLLGPLWAWFARVNQDVWRAVTDLAGFFLGHPVVIVAVVAALVWHVLRKH